MNLKGYLSAHDGHMVFAPSKLPYLAKYHLENGTMVKDWNFYFDRSFYECKDYNLLFSKARSFGQVLDLAMDDQYIYILSRAQLPLLHTNFLSDSLFLLLCHYMHIQL